jgi:hypothetical protein
MYVHIAINVWSSLGPFLLSIVCRKSWWCGQHRSEDSKKKKKRKEKKERKDKKKKTRVIFRCWYLVDVRAWLDFSVSLTYSLPPMQAYLESEWGTDNPRRTRCPMKSGDVDRGLEKGPLWVLFLTSSRSSSSSLLTSKTFPRYLCHKDKTKRARECSSGKIT